jgi:hypothetical protein
MWNQGVPISRHIGLSPIKKSETLSMQLELPIVKLARRTSLHPLRWKISGQNWKDDFAMHVREAHVASGETHG